MSVMEDMWTRSLCGLWLVFLVGLGRFSAFNLDTDNVLRKSGEPDSLFGFSLAMHWQLNPVDKRILLVGSPRAKALSGQKAKVTGGLYSCDISSSTTGCERLDFDNEEDPKKESKENQWMGVTVNSQGPGGKIVTCAHRYQRRTNVNTPIESRDIIGRCYVLSQDLTIDPRSSEDGGSWHFCESRPRGHEMFGSCQQGLSATFDKDYHYIIFGAPGAYNWKGVVRLEQKNDTLLEMDIYDDGPFEVGDENSKNPDLVPAPPNSYLGFSLDSGKSLTKKGQLTVVAGAPRAHHSGEVVLLKKGGDTSSILIKEFTLEGEGLASSFGYDLAVLDLNNDGWQDIVVGAPQYFEKEGVIGGAIYVYINKAGKWDDITPIRIDGPQNSMFGLSVENLGDINQDGYDDVAVGAPYDSNGAGNVYIYHGSDKGLNSKKDAQILSGEPLGVKLFGYSLAGNMDLDRNTYPDLAVGSLSDSVFVYRARPVIKIIKDIKFMPKQIDLTQKNCGNNFCLNVEACFSYKAMPTNYAPKLTVAYTLEADAENLLPRAAFTQRTGSSHNHESKGIVVIDGQEKKKCITREIVIQDNIRDKLHGIPIDVSVEIQGAKRKRRQDTNAALAPVLDAKDPPKAGFQVQFVKQGCGLDNICRSNLLVTYRYGHRTTDQDVFTPLTMDNGLPVVSLADQTDIALEITVTNLNGDDAHEASVIATFPPSLTYSAFDAPPNEVVCVANKDGSRADCELGNPFKRDSQTTFYILLDTAGIALTTKEVEINLQLETTSDQQKIEHVKAKAKVIVMLQLSVSGQALPSQAYFSGAVKGESAMKTESDMGNPIKFQFRVINLGTRLAGLGNASLVINWPKETSDGKWLLYLMKISSTGVDQIRCTPEREINPRTLKEEPAKSRTRRAIENNKDHDEGSIALLTDKRKTETLSCNKGAKCVELICPLFGMDSNAMIMLHARLWNSTFLEGFSKLNYIDIPVMASLRVDGASDNMVLHNAETEVRLTVFPERREAQHGATPWWIIVVSILLGLLLLALLVFLLWKCGVFGKKEKEDNHPSDKERLTSSA
ncbi:integrin alpha-6-like isoform X2 [Genypterus blacodes]|uniref:integrin alpha-6-like isoform X2 n=1 Tax=Genypterus blacodes TaxID=154954 RepID=UPI003F777145